MQFRLPARLRFTDGGNDHFRLRMLQVFPAQAGVIPLSVPNLNGNLCIPRASGGDPDQDDNNAELSRYSPICGDDLNLEKVGRLSNFVVLAYGE